MKGRRKDGHHRKKGEPEIRDNRKGPKNGLTIDEMKLEASKIIV
jgi:hypothetical protein